MTGRAGSREGEKPWDLRASGGKAELCVLFVPYGVCRTKKPTKLKISAVSLSSPVTWDT